MRVRIPSLLIGIAALLLSTAAQAGTLTSASWLQVIQGFPMTRTFNRGLSAPPFTIAGNAFGTSSIAVNLTYPAVISKFFVPKTANGVIDLAISITQGGSQAITATPGGATANQAVAGAVRVRVASHAVAGVNFSQFMTGMTTLLQVPLSIGVDGQQTGSFVVTGVQHHITVDFIGWTPGVVTFTGLTSLGKPLPSVTAAGSWSLTAGGGGTVTLVAPSKISVDGAFAQRRTASFAALKMYLVPEPSALLLIGAGALGLVLFGRGRG
jgi:hypothetical protein